MQADDARTLLAYGRWANRRALAAAAALSPSAFERDLGVSFGSVKGTLVHILGGEWHWLRFFLKEPAQPLPAAESFLDAAELVEAFGPLEEASIRLAAGLTDADLSERRRVRAGEYVLGDLILHFSNHSTYHRGQISAMLRQLGKAPPPTDLRVFLDERAGTASGAGAA